MSLNGMAEVLEVKVTWGTQVLALRHLEAGAGFAIGDGGDFAVPNVAKTEVVRVHDGRWLVTVPGRGPIDVDAGTRVSMEVEGVTIDVASVRAEAIVERGFFAPLATAIAATLCVSFIAHVTAVATMASFPPPPREEDGPTREQFLAMKVLLDAAAERESEEKSEDVDRESIGPSRREYPDVFESEPRRWDPSVPKGPILREGEVSSTGKLPTEIIQRIARQSFGRFRVCYEAGLRKHPKLEGLVTTNLVIGRDGVVKHVIDGGSDLPNDEVVACVVRSFKDLSFPAPEAGIVTASYPISFEPGE